MRAQSYNPRFTKPPFSSRTVGFPESGWRSQLFIMQSSREFLGLSACSHTPNSSRNLPHTSTTPSWSAYWGLWVPLQQFIYSSLCTESSFASHKVLPYPRSSFSRFPPTLLGVRHYYELMRQTHYLCWSPLLRFVPTVSADNRLFPVLSLLIFPRCLIPYPGGLWGACSHYFPQSIDLLFLAKRSATPKSPYSNFGMV